MARFDISVLGELNCDLILYGLPLVLEPEREHLATDFVMTLGSSSAIFAHNISLLEAALVSLRAWEAIRWGSFVWSVCRRVALTSLA